MDQRTATDIPTVGARTASFDWRALARRRRFVIAVVAAAVLAVWLVSWLAARAGVVATNDARIAADMVAVSADVSGRITAVRVSAGDRVAAGDLLCQIDDREARHLLAEHIAERDSLAAQIERERIRLGLVGSKSGTQVDASRADVRSARANVEAARSDLSMTESEFARAEGLFEGGWLTHDDWDEAQNRLSAAQQELRAAEARLASAAAQEREAVISQDDASIVQQDLQVLEAALAQAAAKVARQEVVVDHHQVRSPIDGVVDEVFVDPGERALQGFRVALLHDPEAVWVSANVKETQIRHVRVGAPVRIKVDSAPSAKVSGRVAVIRDLTVAESALMPNPNATGVFTKITQRIPVKILLDETDAVLRPGSMARVAIERGEPAAGE
ncbi:MAG: efflux RND transporter periplasmic adaptor subunit [Pseudomonadota bacterium]